MDYTNFGMHDWSFYLNLAVALSITLGHYLFDTPKSGRSIAVMGALGAIWFAWLFGLGFFSQVHVRDVLGGVLSYCVFSFVFLSDLLRYKLGTWLTEKRGEKWTKEIDYLYLGLAGLGLLMSIGQLNIVTDKISVPGTFGVLAVATALVLRAIKTRAEIAGWNKLPAAPSN
jgi:hypothetical protein